MNIKGNNKSKICKTEYDTALYSSEAYLRYSPISEEDQQKLYLGMKMLGQDIKPSCFVELYDGDLYQIANCAINMALEISKNPHCADAEINTFVEQVAGLLPKPVAETIKDKIGEIGKNRIESAMTNFDEGIYSLSGDFEYPDGNIDVSFISEKGRFFAFLSRIYPFRCTILSLDENGNVVLSKDHFEVFANEFSERGLIEVIRKFCKK